MSHPVTDRPMAHARPRQEEPGCDCGSGIAKVSTVFTAVISILLAYLFLDVIAATVLSSLAIILLVGILAGSSCCSLPANSPGLYQRPQGYFTPAPTYTPSYVQTYQHVARPQVRQHYSSSASYVPVSAQPIPGGGGATLVTSVNRNHPAMSGLRHAIPGQRAR